MIDQKFNIRVYGILINNQDQLLVSDERVQGLDFTKFPGGGLEWGEGLKDCLKREFLEELNQPIDIIEHFYTTGFFQESAFKKNDQLISIYYKVQPLGEIKFNISNNRFDFEDTPGRQEKHRWVNMTDLEPMEFRWPIDKVVARMLQKEYPRT